MSSRIFLAIVVVQFALVACSQKKAEKSVSPPPQQTEVNEYPTINLRLEDGKEIAARELKGNNVFVLFQPDCDHCQQEAIQIEQRLEAFKDYTLYFISSAPMESIVSFAKSFELHGKENVKFAWTSTEGVLNTYGAIQTPSIYIYTNGRLRQAFNGQTGIENILRAL